MKLSKKQLREFIQLVNEDSYDSLETIQQVVSIITDALLTEWRAEYNESDPSMSHLGQDDWNDQVSEAVSKIEISASKIPTQAGVVRYLQRLLVIINSIEEKLMAGEFTGFGY